MIPSQELDLILAQEITRRIGGDHDPPPTLDALRAALHVLKGSAGMTGHHDLTLLVTQYGQRVRSGESDAVTEIVDLLRAAASRLEKGLPPFAARWPEPPPGLVPSQIPSDQRSDYLNAMQDRLGELEAIVRLGFGDEHQLVAACRSVHSMKALASGVGDDVTAWYCHHLEARLRHPAEERPGSAELFLEISNHRATLLRLVESPDHALEMLRVLAPTRPSKRVSQPAHAASEPSGLDRSFLELRSGRSSTLPPGAETEADAESAIRVPTAALEHFSAQVEGMGTIADRLLATADEAQHLGRALRALQQEFAVIRQAFPALPRSDEAACPSAMLRLKESLRTSPLDRLAASVDTLTDLSVSADRVRDECRDGADALRSSWRETRGQLAQLRRTTLAKVFARCERAAQRYAEAEGKRVQVDSVGGALSLERSLAERLIEPLLQITKNAVCHGIELPPTRLKHGKPEAGCLRLLAEPQEGWLRIVVEDDGRGVDLERVRSCAVEQGLLTENEAAGVGEDELLNLLFIPGLSTCADPGMIAGWGMGLDLARDVVRRLGGTVRVSALSPAGVRVTLELPSETA
ncbi:MAG TPA: Hpt domain-containing protein [Polyangiaceae bacterium]|nr:Hpt domain-containing protein [Polyangiaceae bacterium]